MLKDYIVQLDEIAEGIIDKEVSDKGIETYLNQKLFYLDASRKLSDGLRPEQTISFVYRYDISTYLYAVTKYIKEDTDKWIDKLSELHEANLAYEEANPPIVYDTKTHKTKTTRRKVKEQSIPGFEKPSKASSKLASIKGLKLKLNIVKQNDTV